MKLTPQIYAAAGLVFVAFLFSIGSILGGMPSYPIDDEAIMSLQISSKKGKVYESANATQPIVDAASGQRKHNPWNLKAERVKRQTTLPDPPPPTLQSPDPIILPLPMEKN